MTRRVVAGLPPPQEPVEDHGVEERLERVVGVPHRRVDRRRRVGRRGQRLVARPEPVGLVVDDQVARLARLFGDPQHDVDRSREVAAEALVTQGRVGELVGEPADRVAVGQVAAQQRRDVTQGHLAGQPEVAAGQRQLEVELAKAVAQRQPAQRRTPGERAQRRVADGDQRGHQLLTVDLDRPAHELVVEDGAQLGLEVAAVVGRGGVGVLEDGVDQRAELGADRQPRHRGGHGERVVADARLHGHLGVGFVVARHHLGLAADGRHQGRLDVGQGAVGGTPPRGVDLAVEGPHGQRRPLVGRRLDPGQRPARRLGHQRTLVAPVGEELHDPLVGTDRGLVGHLGRAGLAGEQPVERRGGGVLGRRRPPRHDLGARPGQGDVEQPQRLAPVFRVGAGDVVAPLARAAADRDAPLALVVVEERHVGVAGIAVPQRRQVDDGVLEALAGVDRHQLDRGRVGVEPADPGGAAVAAPLGDLATQPGERRRQAEVVCEADGVEHLADVAQVGQQALAPDHAEHPRGHARDRRGLEHGRHPTGGEELGPHPHPVGELLGEVGATGVELGRGRAEEAGQRGRAHLRRAVGLVERLEQRQPLDGRRRREDAAAPADHGRDADLTQRGLDVGEGAVVVGEDGDVAGAELAAAVGRPRGQQAAYVEREVAGDVGPDLADLRAAAPHAQVLPAYDAEPERRLGRCADEGAVGVGGVDGVDGDVGVAELGAAEEPVESPHQRRVAAVVGVERAPVAGGAGGLEVGRHVAAAEGVDRLLGVADEDHRRDAGEGAVEDRPLDRVGVLELVDEHDLPAAAHPVAGGAVGVLERGRELAEQVVVGEDAEPPLAACDLVSDGAREPHPPGGHARRLVGGLEPRLRVAHRAARDGERLAVGEVGVVGLGEAAEVEIVGDLDHEVVEILDQTGVGVGVARDAERGEHEVAELVGGRDGRGVEVDQRLGQPGVHLRAVVAGEQQPEQRRRLVGQHRLRCERAGRLDQLLAHPFAQLLARGAAEGHDQHLLEPAHPLGDVAGDQGGDGPGLAGAGARLQQRRAGRQRPGHVEGEQGRSVGPFARSLARPTLVSVAHRVTLRSIPRSSGSHTVTARSSMPSATSTSSGAFSPWTRTCQASSRSPGTGEPSAPAQAVKAGRAPGAPSRRAATASAVSGGSGSGRVSPSSRSATSARNHSSARWSTGPET